MSSFPGVYTLIRHDHGQELALLSKNKEKEKVAKIDEIKELLTKETKYRVKEGKFHQKVDLILL